MESQITEKQTCLEILEERFEYLFEKELIKAMCRDGQFGTYPEGKIIMDIGQKLTHIPLIISGSIKILREDKEGNDLLLYYLEVGDTCAVTLNCCTKPTKSLIKAVTEKDTQLLFIPVQKMDEWMINFQSWRAFVLESFNTRLNEMIDAIDNLAFSNMEERLYKYLKDRVMITKTPKIQITHFQIANDLHSSRVVISRLMKKLENEGQIIQHRNFVEVREYL